MSDKWNQFQNLEKALSLFDIVDGKLTAVTRIANESFGHTARLFKGVFKPLQTHWANAEKITSIYGTATINMSSVKEGMNILREFMQLHESIDEHIKYLKDFTTNTITELTRIKNGDGTQITAEGYRRLISPGSAAHLIAVADEYQSYCKKLDESLNSFTRYLLDLDDFMKMLGSNNSPETLSLIKENSDLAESIRLFISSFREDWRYRDAFQESVTEIAHCLSGMSSVLETNKEVSGSIQNVKNRSIL